MNWWVTDSAGWPTETTSAIVKIDQRLAMTAKIQAECYCMTCGETGIHAHTTRQERMGDIKC